MSAPTIHPISPPPGGLAERGTVSPEAFTNVMRRHPAGVTIITVASDDGPVGFTATSPSGLSASPALVSFNIGLSSSSLSAVLAADTAMIHLLGSDAEHLVTRFSGPADRRFSDPALHEVAATGEPVVTPARARMRVALDEYIPAGDHVLVIASVLDTWLHDEPAEGLVWGDGAFHRLD